MIVEQASIRMRQSLAPVTEGEVGIARFVDHLFSRIGKLQEPGFDPKWKSINLAATVPGLARFPAAQAWLERQPHATHASQ